MKIVRAILAGERDPPVLAELRDRRCKHSEAEIATALDGRYRPEHVAELRSCLALWDEYQKVIAELDAEIAAHLRTDAAADRVAAAPAEAAGAGQEAARPGVRRADGVVLRRRAWT